MEFEAGSVGSAGARKTSRPNVVLAMLMVVYVFNFLDRQILAILAAPIQMDLGLSDREMGLLGGIAFALLFSTAAVPIAWLADRTSRSWVITVSLVCWSGFTALCGLAHNFWHIFLARVGVGIGEAGGVAPSHALIGEYFPSHRRAFALSVYSLGIPIGSAIGVLAGAYIATAVDWRAAFIVIGFAGVLVAPVFKFMVNDRMLAAQTGSPPRDAPHFSAIAGMLARKPSFWLLSFGASMSSMIGYGLAFWLPSLLQRSFALDIAQSSYFIGALQIIGGGVGILAGGWLADRLGARDRAFFAWVPALAFVVAVPLLAVGMYSSRSIWVVFALLVVPQALIYMWLGPIITAIQHLVSPPARSTASASFLLINNLIGLGGGIYALGALSDVLAPIYGQESLRHSMLYSLGLYLLAALLMALAGPGLRRAWVIDEAT